MKKKEKGSTIITRTDSRGRIKTIDVHGPAANALYQALLKGHGMGQTPNTDMEKYGEEKPKEEKSIEQRAEEEAQRKADEVKKALEPTPPPASVEKPAEDPTQGEAD